VHSLLWFSRHSNCFINCNLPFKISHISVSDLLICARPPSVPPVRVESTPSSPTITWFGTHPSLSTHGASPVQLLACSSPRLFSSSPVQRSAPRLLTRTSLFFQILITHANDLPAEVCATWLITLRDRVLGERDLIACMYHCTSVSHYPLLSI